MAAAFQSDAFQGDAFESSTYTLTVDAGTLALTGASVLLSWSGSPLLLVDPGTLTLTGQSVNLTYGTVLSVTAESLTLTGQSVALSTASIVTVLPGTLTLTGQSVTLSLGYKLTATSQPLVLTPQTVVLSAQHTESFTLNFIIDIYVPTTSQTTHSLTVDGTPVKRRSWQYEETADSIYGTFNGELANLSQKSLLTPTAAINWTVNGTQLIDTGRLERKDYSIARQGIGPDDRVSFVAMPEMEALLNTVPSTPLILFDPERHNVTADDFQGIYDTDNNFTPATVTSVADLSFHTLLDLIMVDECGFTNFLTNIPDFPIMSIVEFPAGVAYFNTIGNLIGMFNPEINTIDEGAGPILTIYDGTTGSPAGMPTPRQITCSHATSLGVATELARVDSLLIDVTKDRFYYDYVTARSPEIETIDEGQFGDFGAEYTSTTITNYYYDFFRDSMPNTPVKTELRQQTTSVSLEPFGDVFLTTDENFYFDRWGRVYQRRKVTMAEVPDPFTDFIIGLTEVETEDEQITYRMHPFRPRAYYTARREINRGGIIYIDGENQQLGINYARDVINAWRSGNVVDTMSGVYGKTWQFIETITPRSDKRIKVTNYEIDFTPVAVGQNPIFLTGDSSEKDGEVGVNIFVQEQQQMYIFSPGESEIGGTIERVNMGELPQETAVALGERILHQRSQLPNRVSLSLPYIDTSLTKGTPVNVLGRSGEDLGNYIIEARTMTAQEFNNGPLFSMTLQARQAD